MTCTDFKALTAKAGTDGDLTNAEMASCLKHLKDCVGCDRWIERLTAGAPMTPEFVRWAEGRCVRMEDDPEAMGVLLPGEGR
jgi:predicted anti-sigma-YlaC factor YlaD